MSSQPPEPVSPPPRASRLAVVGGVLAFGTLGALGGWFLKERGRANAAAPERSTPAERAAGRHAARGGTPEQACGPLDPTLAAGLEFAAGVVPLDFGLVEQGQVETREIPFRSTGAGALCIMDVSGSCACFSAQLKDPKKRRYEPGETGAVLVTMNTTGKEGRVVKDVTLYTNRRAGGLVKAEVRCEVAKGLVVHAGMLRFPHGVPGKPSRATLTFSAPVEDGPFDVTAVVGTRRKGPDGEPLRYGLETSAFEEGGRRKLQVVVVHPPEAATGSWQDALAFATTHPRRPEVVLQSVYQVMDRIRTSVPSVALAPVGAGRNVRPMRVRVYAGVPGLVFRVVGIAVEPREGHEMPADGTGFVAEHGRDAQGWWIDVAWDGREREAGQLLEADLVVRTDDLELPELRLPIRAETR